MTFKVMAERCDQCLYGANKIVSNERRTEIIRKITREDGHFICHKASIAKCEIACKGDWDQRGCGQIGRIMDRLGVVEFVPVPGDA